MEGVKPLIKKMVDDVIAPKLEQFAETVKMKKDEYLIPRREHFEEYLFRSYKNYNIVNTLVLRNEQKLLLDLYVPLSLVKRKYQWEAGEKTIIDKYPIDLVKKYNKILITDTAGMGKSTLAKRLFLDVIENGHGIPVFIELRRLTKDRPILDDIHNQINSLTKVFDRKLLLQFIQTGGFVFFLDGYDEIPLERRKEVTSDIQSFISKADNNVFFMTSRPERVLSSFGNFQVFSIHPLQKKEAYQLLRNYDDRGDVSNSLVEELKTGRHEAINEFLKNPLLVSLLFAAYNHKKDIPIEKHIFYRNVYDAYFDEFDLTKDGYKREKKSELNTVNFNRILRYIGFFSFKSQRIEFDKEELLLIIKNAKESCSDLTFDESAFLDDLLVAVPLFCEDGLYYRWVHKSLQEYFAAQFIYQDSKVNQDLILKALYKSDKIEKYYNLLDLYYDIDNWGFRKNILLPLCESYVEYYKNSYFNSKVIQKDDIEKRISLLFMRKVLLLQSPNKFHTNEIIKSVEWLNKKQVYKATWYFYPIFEEKEAVIYGYEGKHHIIRLLEGKQKKIFYKSIVGESLVVKKLSWSNFSNKHQIKAVLRNRKELAGFDKSFSGLKHQRDKLIIIDIHTCEDNADNYKMINFYLNYFSTGIRSDLRCFLNYEKCVKEIENINKSIEVKENSNEMASGW